MPNPVLRSFSAGNPQNWGKLVKSWATGKNYFVDPPNGPAPLLPRTVEELVKTANDHGCDVKVAPWVKGLSFVIHGQETLTMRLPPKDLIERSEAMLTGQPYKNAGDKSMNVAAGAPMKYPLSQFYADFMALQSAGNPTPADAIDFHHARVGEYTVNSCA